MDGSSNARQVVGSLRSAPEEGGLIEGTAMGLSRFLDGSAGSLRAARGVSSSSSNSRGLLERIHALKATENTVPALHEALSQALREVQALQGALVALREDSGRRLEDTAARGHRMEQLMREMIAERDALLLAMDNRTTQIDEPCPSCGCRRRVEATKQRRGESSNTTAEESVFARPRTDSNERNSTGTQTSSPDAGCRSLGLPSSSTPVSRHPLSTLEGAATLLVYALSRYADPEVGGGWRWGAVVESGGTLCLRYTTREGWSAWHTSASSSPPHISSLAPATHSAFNVEALAQLIYSFAVDGFVHRALGYPSDGELLISLLGALGAGRCAAPRRTSWPASQLAGAAGSSHDEGFDMLVRAVASSRASCYDDSTLRPLVVVGRHMDGTDVLILDCAPFGQHDHVFLVSAYDSDGEKGAVGGVLSSWVPRRVLDSQLASYAVIEGASEVQGGGIPSPSRILFATVLSVPCGRGGPTHAALGTDVWLHGPRDCLPPMGVIDRVLGAVAILPEYPEVTEIPLQLVRRGANRCLLRSSELVRWYSALQDRPPCVAVTVCLTVQPQQRWGCAVGRHAGGGRLDGDGVEHVASILSAISFVRPTADGCDGMDSSTPLHWPLRAQVNGVDRFASTVALMDDDDSSPCEVTAELITALPPTMAPGSGPLRAAGAKGSSSSVSFHLMRSFLATHPRSVSLSAGSTSPDVRRSPRHYGASAGRVVSPSRAQTPPNVTRCALKCDPRPSSPSRRSYSSPAKGSNPSFAPGPTAGITPQSAVSAGGRGERGGRVTFAPSARANHYYGALDARFIDEYRVLNKARGPSAARRDAHTVVASKALARHAVAYLGWLDACTEVMAAHAAAAGQCYATHSAVACGDTAMGLWASRVDAAMHCYAAKEVAFGDECGWRVESNLYGMELLVATAQAWCEAALAASHEAMSEKLAVVVEEVSPRVAVSYSVPDAMDSHVGAFMRGATRWAEGVAAVGLGHSERLLQCHVPFIEEVRNARRLVRGVDAQRGGLAIRYEELVREHQLALDRVATARVEAASARADLEDAVSALVASQEANQSMRRRFALEMTQRDEEMAMVRRRADAPGAGASDDGGISNGYVPPRGPSSRRHSSVSYIHPGNGVFMSDRVNNDSHASGRGDDGYFILPSF